MYNHNKAQQSKNRVHISWDILYLKNEKLSLELSLHDLLNMEKICYTFIVHTKYMEMIDAVVVLIHLAIGFGALVFGSSEFYATAFIELFYIYMMAPFVGFI